MNPRSVRQTIAIFAVTVSIFLAGCSMTAVANHPGAVNAFDSQTYDVLLTAQAAIEAAKPLATTQPIKDVLNKAIAAYNVAEAAYTAYHQAAIAGTATATQQSTLQQQVASLKTATAALPVAATPSPAKP